jgi:protoporphyrinogen oxidase
VARVAVIGAGAMGLAAAYHVVRAGHDVTVLEADSIPGGMAAHFDFGGLSIERYYHFVCRPDRATFELMAELGIGDKIRWVATSMGYFTGGKLHDWGNPLALLRFPGLSLLEKLRYGLMMYCAVKRTAPAALEQLSARKWIEAWCGAELYARLWKPLFELKFYDYADDISAAWIWTRIKRLGLSRRSLMQEELGYIEGGSGTLIDALARAIESLGGKIRLAARVEDVIISDERVRAVRVGGELAPADFVISTIPTPLLSRSMPALPAALKATYEGIRNIGVACLVLKLKTQVTPHFWVNISDERIPVPGFVEFSNLRPLPATVVYVPFYMPVTHQRWAHADSRLLAEAFACLQQVNPRLSESDLLDSRVGRLRFAQPICPPGFAARIPSVQTPIAGLQVADTCFYYPEDRGISESVRYGRLMARAIDDPGVWGRRGAA